MAEVSMSRFTPLMAAGDEYRANFRVGARAKLVALVLAVRCAEAAPTDAQLDGSVRVGVWFGGFRQVIDTFAPLVHRGGIVTIPIAGEVDSNGDVNVDISDARDAAGVAFAVRASVSLVVNERNDIAPRW